MRSPINVVKKVAITPYYLRIEGRFRKTANAFVISRKSVSKVFSLDKNKFICPLATEKDVKDLVARFYYSYDFPK